MKITSEESLAQIRSVLQNPTENTAPTKAHREQSSDGDQVQLSPKAKELQRIKDSLENVPEVRQAKVAEMKLALQRGTYQPDSSKTAENIIKESIIDLLL